MSSSSSKSKVTHSASDTDPDSSLKPNRLSGWKPLLPGRLCRITLGLLFLYSAPIIVEDPWCILYWLVFLWTMYFVKFAITIGCNASVYDVLLVELPRAAVISVLLWAIIIEFCMYGWDAWANLSFPIIVTKYVIYGILLFQGCAFILCGLFGLQGNEFASYSYCYQKCRGGKGSNRIKGRKTRKSKNTKRHGNRGRGRDSDSSDDSDDSDDDVDTDQDMNVAAHRIATNTRKQDFVDSSVSVTYFFDYLEFKYLLPLTKNRNLEKVHTL